MNKIENIGFVFGVVGIVLGAVLQLLTLHTNNSYAPLLSILEAIIFCCGLSALLFGLFSEIKRMSMGWIIISLGQVVILFAVINYMLE